MVRTVIIPAGTDIHLSIPKDYVGKEIEVTCLALDELEQGQPGKKTMADFWGVISDKTAGILHEQVQQSRDEWNRSI